MELLDALGFETGADRFKFHKHARAGLESDPLNPEAAHVVKNPEFSVQLREMIESGRLDPARVEWLLIPLRSLDDAAASRVRVTLEQGAIDAPGGLFETGRPKKQRERLAEITYQLLETAALYEIPVILLEYPRFVTDSAYAQRRLEPLLCNNPMIEFDEAWRSVVNPRYISPEPLAMPRFITVRAIPLQLRFLFNTKLKPVRRWFSSSRSAKGH